MLLDNPLPWVKMGAARHSTLYTPRQTLNPQQHNNLLTTFLQEYTMYLE